MYAPPLISSLSAASLAKTPASQQAWVSLGGCIATPAHVLGVLLRPPRAAPAITVPISCRQTSREQGCPPDPPLPLALAIPVPSFSHRDAGGLLFTNMRRVVDCPTTQPQASLIPAMVQLA